MTNKTILPEDYHLRDRLGFTLSRLSRLMQNRLEAQLALHGVNRLKWCVLSGVEIEGHDTPSALADHIGITRPAISRLLRGMIKDGLIERSLGAADGRSRQITVTDLGRQKLNACWPLVQANQDHFVAKLTADQRQMLQTALREMIAGETDRLDDF